MTSPDTPSDDTSSPARRIVLTAAGLVLLAGSFAFAVPRRAEIAAALAPPIALEVPAEMPDMDAPEPAAEGPSSSAPSDPPPPAASGVSGDAATTPPAADTTTAAPALRTASTEPAETTEVLARPVAIDTATFLVGRARVKLAGVEAPEAARRCETGAGGTWPCGAKARTALRAWLRARSIRCDVPKDFAKSATTTTSRCDLADKDIGEWLVENGWSAATPGGPYEEAEAKARASRLGLWGGG